MPPYVTVEGAVCAAVIAGIEVGGVELSKEDVIRKVETREEERTLGWERKKRTKTA